MRAAPWLAAAALLSTAALVGFGARSETLRLQSQWQDEVDARIETLGAEDVSARVDGRTVRLTGTIANASVQEAMVRDLSRIAGLTSVENRLEIADAPLEPSESTEDVVEHAAQGIGRNNSATENELDDARASAVTSDAPSAATKSATNEACREALRSLLAVQSLHFAAYSAAIVGATDTTFDDIAAAMTRCPGSVVEISGHADGQGIDELNDTLSRARAEAVRQHLVRRGIAADRLIAVGHGDRQPVADDTTEEGRLRNRRIELRLQEDSR